MDWNKWHGLYSDRRPLQRRLALVRSHIAAGLDAAAPGPIPVLSICAGDGRDLKSVMERHGRAGDVRARMVEVDHRLVAAGRAAFEEAGFKGLVDYRVADATDPASYAGLEPARLLIACGMLGLVSPATTSDFVRALTGLMAPGGSLVWTRSRGLRDGDAHLAQFRACLSQCGFEEQRTDVTRRSLLPWARRREVQFVVVTSTFAGPTRSLPEGPLFEIVDL